MKNYFFVTAYIFLVIYLSLGAGYLWHDIGSKIHPVQPLLHTFDNCLYYYFSKKGEVVHLPAKKRGMFEFKPSDQECGE